VNEIWIKEITSNNPGVWYKYEVLYKNSLVGNVETELSKYYNPPAFVIYKIVIDPAYRRQGIGKQVLNHFKKRARESGYSRFMAKIHPLDKQVSFSNLENFYTHCGFKIENIDGDHFAVIELNHYTEPYKSIQTN